MEKSASFYLTIITALLLWSCPTFATTSVWKVEKDGNTIYLGGTVHLLRSTDFPLPDEFHHAYSSSGRLFFEVDVGAMNAPQAQALMLRMMAAEPGRRLGDILTPETYREYAAALQARDMNIQMVEPFKVGMGIVSLQLAEFMRMGLSLEGVDMYYYKLAATDKLPRGYLETMEEQIRHMATLGRGWEEELIRLTLRDLDKTAELYDEMNSAWRTGDLDRLDRLFIREMKNDYPEAYGEMLVQRNLDWLPQIEQMFSEPGTEFVLVGVAHMVGDDGLLQLLKERGYKVTQL